MKIKNPNLLGLSNEHSTRIANNQMKNFQFTSNSGVSFCDSAIVLKSLNHGPIRGFGGAAHPGFPPATRTSPSLICGVPNPRMQIRTNITFFISLLFPL
jgi:hypothetical protein